MRIRNVITAAGASLLLFVAACDVSVEETGTPPAETAEPVVEETTEVEPEPDIPASQANALRAAESYINTMPFSETGLVEQLEFEDYSTEDAEWAVSQLDVDWNEQAVLAAESYNDTMPFSRDGLIDQLVFDGFTTEQATYGVDQLGL